MPSIILWNSRRSGHHPVYMRALVDVAISMYSDVWVPSWITAYLPRPALRNVSLLPQEAASDFKAMADFARERRPDLTIIADGTSHMHSLALHGWPSRLAVIDIRTQQCDLVFGHGIRRPWGALHLVLRECVVRRQTTTFHVLDHRACAIGTRRLRRATIPLPELRQTYSLGQIPAASAPSDSPRTAVLMGALDKRKGLEVVIEAAEALSAESQGSQIQFVVAGRPVDRYLPEITRIRKRAQRAGLPISFRLHHLSEFEYFQTLFDADYVLLPYLRHRGGSGLLASLDGYRGHVVVSDRGWLGEVARRLGLHTFQEGDGVHLAKIIQALEMQRGCGRSQSALRLPSSLYAGAETFGRTILGGSDA